MFDVIFTYLRTVLTPTRLRKPKFLSWLSLVVSYLKNIYDDYVSFREIKLYEINFTGQLMYLQKKLRDNFCYSIEITDGVLLLPTYISNKEEQNLPVYIANKSENYYLWLSNQDEITGQNDFIVKIPAHCYNDMTDNDFLKMRTIIDYYKLVNKRYSIISI